VPAVENDDVIQAIPANGSDHALHVRRYLGAVSYGKASEICLAVHSAEGWSVTLKCRTLRRSWDKIRNTNRTSNVAVGTVKKSTATKSPTWLSRNVRQVCDGGRFDRSMYPATVDWETWMPSLASSDWIRGVHGIIFSDNCLTGN